MGRYLLISEIFQRLPRQLPSIAVVRVRLPFRLPRISRLILKSTNTFRFSTPFSLIIPVAMGIGLVGIVGGRFLDWHQLEDEQNIGRGADLCRPVAY